MSKNKAKSFAVGAVIAGVFGYLAGLLTAPKSGKETRKDIQNKALQTKHQAEKQLKNLHSELDNMLKQGKDESKKLTATAKKDWETAFASATKAKDKVRAVLSSLHEGDTDDKDLQKAVKQAEEAAQHLKDYLAKTAKSAKSAATKAK